MDIGVERGYCSTCLTRLVTVEHYTKSPLSYHCKMCAMCHMIPDPAEHCDICKAKKYKKKWSKKK
jgi:hypothetical protein